MQNIRNIIRYCSLCLSLFLFAFSPNFIGATEVPFHIQYERAIQSHNKIELLDAFIDAGIYYTKLTGKRFDYKKCMKLSYKKIKESGYKVDKKDKRNFENAFYSRLEYRFTDSTFTKVYVDPRGEKEKESDSNFIEAIAYVGGGVAAQFVPCGATNALGGAAIIHGVSLFYEEARKCWKDPDHRNDSHERDKSNGNQSQSQKDREKKDHGTFG